MMKQVLIFLAAVAVCSARGDGYASKKSSPQAASQYASVAQFHSQQAPSQPIQPRPEPQRAPSPYNFGYQADSSSRQESSDASGKVSGSYQVTNEDGSVRLVKYVADENGFRADVDTNEPGTKSDSPADVRFNSAAVEAPARQSAQGYSQNTPSSVERIQRPRGSNGMASATHQQAPLCTICSPSMYGQSAPSRQQPQKHSNGWSAAPVQESSASMYGQSSPSRQQQQPSPYAFSYDAQLDDGSSARSESADASGKVTGQYSLSTADGRQRLIKYEADHQGFRAMVDTNEMGTKSDSPANVNFHSSAPQLAPQVAPQAAPQRYSHPAQKTAAAAAAYPTQQIFQAPVVSYQGQSSTQYNAPAQKPSPYSFNYAAELEDGSHSRTESVDENGNVQGSYSLYVADGRSRKVDYIADENGFRATVNTNEFGTKADSPADVQFYSTATQEEPASYSSPNAYKPASSSATMYSRPAAIAQQPIQSPIQFNMGNGNGGYSYNYQSSFQDGGSSAQSESADGSGKVTGYYSMSIPDGRQRKVDYTADSSGFQASVNTNELGTKSDSPAHVSFLSSAPQQAPEPVRQPTSFRAPSAPQQAPEPVRQPTAFRAPSAPQISAQRSSGSANMYNTVTQQRVEPQIESQPSPYAFNYQADASGGSSSRQESGDGSGTVTGSYEVHNEDGSVRVVEYIADKDGFRANVKTNEQGTKSDNPADVAMRSDAPSTPVERVQQRPVQAGNFPARTKTAKSSMLSQQTIDAWTR